MQITPHQRQFALDYLATTRDDLLAAIQLLSPAQWHFRPTENGWSILQIVEHLALIEGRVHGVIQRIPEAPEAEAGRDDLAIDAFILRTLPHPKRKVEAPPIVSPRGQWTPEQAVREFVSVREQTLDLLNAATLRGRVLPHPMFGPWDGYQWILGTAAHTARHTGQIRETHAAAGYPV